MVSLQVLGGQFSSYQPFLFFGFFALTINSKAVSHTHFWVLVNYITSFCCFVDPSIPFILKIMQLYLKVHSISKRLSLLIDRRRFRFHFYVSYVHTIFETIYKNYKGKNICLCFSWRWIVCISVRAYACFQNLIQFIGR